MSDAESKQIERMKSILGTQKSAFRADRQRSLENRKADLAKIAKLCRDNVDAICEAINQDFSCRAKQESVLGEIVFVINDAEHTAKHLKQWMKPKKVSVPLNLKPGKAYIRRDPVGVAGIVAPWNYPFQLALAPLVAALGAGCRAMLKPSEYTPATSELIKTLIGQHFDEDQVAVITGGPAVGQAFTQLKFDHLFYTGSTQVGRLVAKAAAENLVPVTLELGGKSPAIITPSYPVESAAKSITWGKLFNSGQTCVAPDYVLAPKGREDEVASALIAVAQAQFEDVATDDSYSAIVSDRHYQRLHDMIEEARAAGATVLQPEHDTAEAKARRKIPPTVVLNLPAESQLLEEEIFGPVLPVLGYESLDQATDYVSDRDHPLALYVYTTDKAEADRVLGATLSGGVGVNINLLHLSIPDLPFGGIGASGQGAYHGETGFEVFSHNRSVFHTGKWHPSRLLAPPYGKMYENITKRQLK